MVIRKKSRARKRKELLDLLSDFGVTMDDLVYLPEAIKVVKNLLSTKETVVSQTKVESSQQIDKKIATPSQIIEMFTGEEEVLNFR